MLKLRDLLVGQFRMLLEEITDLCPLAAPDQCDTILYSCHFNFPLHSPIAAFLFATRKPCEMLMIKLVSGLWSGNCLGSPKA